MLAGRQAIMGGLRDVTRKIFFFFFLFLLYGEAALLEVACAGSHNHSVIRRTNSGAGSSDAKRKTDSHRAAAESLEGDRDYPIHSVSGKSDRLN